MNPQTSYGDDVLSRILHVRQDPEGLAHLRDDIVAAVNDIVRELAAHAQIDPARIYGATFSGNTTMQHLFAGLDPGSLGELPFVPALGHALSVPAVDVGLHIHPMGRIYMFPVIGGFVGGDTVAGILVTNITEADGPTMLVDIGTNGEIVLYHDGALEAASTAAGPAFEGARITHGMRAAAGAIEIVEFADDLRYRVIGGASPAGICGSALIDIVAGLLANGIVLPQGMMLRPDDLPAAASATLRDRVIDGPDGPEFVIAREEESQTGRPLTVSHRDIRQLQLAVAAIRAGVAILLRRAGLTARDLESFLIAGAFGNYVRRDNAQRLGLLPDGIEPERFRFIGNSSLAGARLAAISRGARIRAEELARRAVHVDLSSDLDFQTEYVEAMMFPMET